MRPPESTPSQSTFFKDSTPVFVPFPQSYEMLYFNILLTFSWICGVSSQWVKYAPLVLWHLAVAMVVHRIYRLRATVSS